MFKYKNYFRTLYETSNVLTFDTEIGTLKTVTSQYGVQCPTFNCNFENSFVEKIILTLFLCAG